MKSSATKTTNAAAIGKAAAITQKITAKKGWLGFLRFVIYSITIIGTFTGASLIKTSGLSSSFADGTASARAANGAAIFTLSIVILSANIIWGTLRWFLRGQKEHWKPGRIIGKLVGGGLWRTAVVIPLALLALFAVTPQITTAITESAHSSDDFHLTPIPSSYDKLLYLEQHLDEFSTEEIQRQAAGLFLSNVRIDPDASNNISHAKSANPFVSTVSAYSTTVTTLNKAKLSDRGNFVIFYTDTGDDAISDQKVAELAEMMEQIIQNYQNNLGFAYKYTKVTNNMYNDVPMHMVLINNGIDKNITDTAMPVYVVNPYEEDDGILATYAGIKFHEFGLNLLTHLDALLSGGASALYASTPSYPFVNILPANADSGSLAIVAAHELGHHYAANYNYDHYGDGGSNDDFVDETAPNWMAINASPDLPIENLINANHYNKCYLSESASDTISQASIACEADGYPAVAFLENYAAIVPDAKTKIMDAVYRGDALNYLYEQAGADDFTKVMIALAEKNLTGAYNGKLYNYTLPRGEELACTDFCTETHQINPASTQYLYFSTSEYLDTTIEFSGGGQARASLLGRGYDGFWQVLDSGQSTAAFTIDESTRDSYEIIALAVANSSLDATQSYQVKIAATALSDLTAESEEGCTELDLDSIFDSLNQLLDAGSQLVGLAIELGGELEPETDFSSAQAEYDQSAAEAKAQISSAREEVANYKITICENYLATDQNYATVRAQLKSALSYNFDIYHDESATGHTDAFAGIDLLSRRGQIYILAEDSGEMGFVTINIAER